MPFHPYSGLAIGPVNLIVGAVEYMQNLHRGTERNRARNADRCGDKKKINWTSDQDDHSRDCTVRWYKRRLVSVAHHWALTFDWGDYKVTYEADDEGGYLIPRWKKGAPEIGPPGGSGAPYVWEEVATFKLKCSPREVNKKAKKIPINGAMSSYILPKIPCHGWVECLAGAFVIVYPGINFPKENMVLEPWASVVDSLNK